MIAGGPFDNASSKVKKGCIIEKINGQEISADTDFYALLAGLTGEKVLISLSDGGKQWDEVVKPISDGACGALLYRRWIKQRAADVDRWSNGRLGYVHIESMDDNSFRTVYSDVLGKYNKKEGIVIDTRFNGGGRLHEDIEILFSGTNISLRCTAEEKRATCRAADGTNLQLWCRARPTIPTLTERLGYTNTCVSANLSALRCLAP